MSLTGTSGNRPAPAVLDERSCPACLGKPCLDMARRGIAAKWVSVGVPPSCPLRARGRSGPEAGSGGGTVAAHAWDEALDGCGGGGFPPAVAGRGLLRLRFGSPEHRFLVQADQSRQRDFAQARRRAAVPDPAVPDPLEPELDPADILGQGDYVEARSSRPVTSAEVSPLLYPRGKGRILIPEASGFRSVLPGYRPDGALPGFAALESFFLVDLATESGGNWLARRRITARVLDPDGLPVADVPVEWSLGQGSGLSRLQAADGSLGTSLVGGQAPRTDADGLAEVVLCHPAQLENAETGEVVQTLQAMAREVSAEIRLTLVRNDSNLDPEDIARRRAAQADALWVFQPQAASRSGSNPGIRALQRILNDVVSRHKGATDFAFVPVDGVFGEDMRNALREYLRKFRAIAAGADHPYDLRGIGVAGELTDYLAAEYAPFDPLHADWEGGIVDRRLLIGEGGWNIAPEAIDGLLEIKEGVVDRLKAEMVRMGQAYVTRGTFWLHRAEHSPFQASTAWVARAKASALVHTAADPASAPLEDAQGNPIQLHAGDLAASPSATATWTQVRLPEGLGWVPTPAVNRVLDNQGDARNHGTLGGPGVAYTYGGKDLPDRYTQRLEANPLAKPVAGAGRQGRIAAWEEYADGHRVGRTSGDPTLTGPNRLAYHTGCDCSGLVQNCITHANFPGEATRRIVPESVLRRITFNAANLASHCVPAVNAVGDYARAIPNPGQDASRRWVEQGDVIATATHIVWVAGETPSLWDDEAGGFDNSFLVYNAYGSTSQRLASGLQAPANPAEFLRKCRLMPFYRWKKNLGNAQLGRPFIWA